MKNLLLNILKPKGVYAKWLIFISLFCIIALGMMGYFDVIKQYLDTDTLTFKAGSYRISVYQILKAILIIALIFWTAAIVSEIADNRIRKFNKIRATNRSLIIKAIHIAIYLFSGILAMDMLGIDLTTLTIFSGALGIGIGFGLQKIASNFISGIILLLEKSVEEGDLVELADGTFGFVRKASARYTLVETFDGKEILVPNEDFITSRVINWTFSNTSGRVEIKLGVSYGSDIEKAREIILAAAKRHPRCIQTPEPKCFLRSFGDSSVDFILHFWVADVTTGRWEPQSEVMFDIWRDFKKHNIEIPFPQRDLHVKSLSGDVLNKALPLKP